MEQMELNELYRSLLMFAGINTDIDGYLFTYYQDKKEHFLIDGLRLVLPTQQHLKTSNVKEKIIFHPLAENQFTEESKVINTLTKAINVRLNVVFVALAESLLSLAASPSEHHKLTPSQTELLVALGDVDETSVKNFISLMMNSFKTEESYRYFIKLYLKRRGTVNGKIHSRAGIVTFPFLEKLLKEESFEPVKLRAKDKLIYANLFEFILPNSNKPESYNFGTSDTVAPYLHTLYKTSELIASNFNDIVKEFADYIDSPEKLLFNSEWVETFENLEVMRNQVRRIPMQGGNEGDAIITKPLAPPPTNAVVNNQPTPLYAPLVQMPVAPAYAVTAYTPPPLPEIKTTNAGLDYNSFLARTQPMATPLTPTFGQPVGYRQQQQQQQTPGFMQPYMQQQQPQYQQPQPYQSAFGGYQNNSNFR